MCVDTTICDTTSTCQHDFENIEWYRKSSLLHSLQIPDNAHNIFGCARDVLYVRICIRCGLIIDETQPFLLKVKSKLNDYEFIKDNKHLRELYAKNLYRKLT